ncbi:GNAT family N-acetyltransferase [Falsiphaeobacter marinintestinus]|uniref:GNAT family N-acetyltransferase n=1 Tax=Falsiphaeobacter marinintestinus TaxID=1492905 RepID=UPI0011B40571|nr:GNAT family N-acetyltransferase [Phaeobacter marinintestinus]
MVRPFAIVESVHRFWFIMLAQSDTLILRRLSSADLCAFQAYRNDPEVGRYQDWSTFSDADAIQFLDHMAQVDPLLRPGHWTQIGIADAETDRLVGDLGLFLAADGTSAEMGITLAASEHRRGHGLTATRLAIGLIWQKSPAQTIRAWGDQRNTASIALMRKVGMTHVGTEENDVTEEAFILERPPAH